jgi:predicted ester cyclase
MNPIEIVRAYEATWDRPDAAAMPGFFTDGGIYVPSGEAALTGQAIADYAAGVFAAFPDTRMPITRIFADGNLVAVEWVYKATMTGDYGPYKATGKYFELTGAHIIEVEGERIKSVLSRWDRLDMLIQLGLV